MGHDHITLTHNGHALKTVCNLIPYKLIIYSYLYTGNYLPQKITKCTIFLSVYDAVYFNENLPVFPSNLSILH
jgi:hypothetical protein